MNGAGPITPALIGSKVRMSHQGSEQNRYVILCSQPFRRSNCDKKEIEDELIDPYIATWN